MKPVLTLEVVYMFIMLLAISILFIVFVAECMFELRFLIVELEAIEVG